MSIDFKLPLNEILPQGESMTLNPLPSWNPGVVIYLMMRVPRSLWVFTLKGMFTDEY